MVGKLKGVLTITLISVLPTLLIWLPFFLRLETVWGIPLREGGMATIVANYDGPLFLVVAKTLYDPELIGNFAFNLPTEYYAAHFPLFPLLTKLLSPIFGFPYSMLIITILSSFLAIYFFSKFIGDYVEKSHVVWMTFLFSFFPARWLIVRSVGSAEPLFLASIIASIYFFKKEKFLLAGIWAALAQLTKSPGILLFVSYFIVLFVPNFKRAAVTSFSKWLNSYELKKLFSICLIPISLFALFVFYKIKLDDFFAYFHSGDNIHLFFPPFQIFNYKQPWVGTFWLEEIIFVYLIILFGIIRLFKMKENVLASFALVFFISTIFVSHRDVVRYSLPVVPFLYAAFSEALTKKEYKIVFLVLIIPTYLFSLAFISQNVMPIPDWAPLL